MKKLSTRPGPSNNFFCKDFSSIRLFQLLSYSKLKKLPSTSNFISLFTGASGFTFKNHSLCVILWGALRDFNNNYKDLTMQYRAMVVIECVTSSAKGRVYSHQLRITFRHQEHIYLFVLFLTFSTYQKQGKECQAIFMFQEKYINGKGGKKVYIHDIVTYSLKFSLKTFESLDILAVCNCIPGTQLLS